MFCMDSLSRFLPRQSHLDPQMTNGFRKSNSFGVVWPFRTRQFLLKQIYMSLFCGSNGNCPVAVCIQNPDSGFRR